MKTAASILSLVCVCTLAAGCAEDENSNPAMVAVGVAALTIAQVPSDVSCVRVNVTGARSVSRTFAVVPGSSPSLLLTGLSLGQNAFSGEAFTESCTVVSSTSLPAWVSAPVTSTLAAGVVAEVSLVFRRDGRAKVGVSFEDDPQALADAAIADAMSVDAGALPDTALPADAGVGCAPVVNEISVAGPAGASDEFVELYNPCPVPYSLANHRLIYRAAAGTTDVLLVNLSSFTLAPNGLLVFGGSTYSGAAPSVATLGGGLAAAGGAVGLQLSGVNLDSVGYGTATNALVEGVAAAAPAAGSSVARVPNGVDTNINAVDFHVGPATPGASNL